MIDNMFIVNPPKEIRKIAEEEEKTTDENGGILDIDYLDFDALEDDALIEKMHLSLPNWILIYLM